MITVYELLAMCRDEYMYQLINWYNWDNLVMALHMPVLAYDMIARGDY